MGSVEISTATRANRQLLAELPPPIHLAFNGSDSYFPALLRRIDQPDDWATRIAMHPVVASLRAVFVNTR
jgi:hypothetical protein